MISHEHKFIFIHYPKTAGETINYLLSNNRHPAFKHRKIRFFEDKYDLKEYFKFTFCRNPWDQVVSFYFHFKRLKVCYPFHSCTIANRLSFSDYCKKMFQSESGACLNHLHHSHYSYLLNSKNNVNIDFIGRFENLQQDFNTVCDKIGIPKQQLPHKNKSKHTHYTEYYDDETREIVAEKYAKDIEYFGYEFGV
jgi:chondroitin 4-sulfotransferase 11